MDFELLRHLDHHADLLDDYRNRVDQLEHHEVFFLRVLHLSLDQREEVLEQLDDVFAVQRRLVDLALLGLEGCGWRRVERACVRPSVPRVDPSFSLQDLLQTGSRLSLQ